MADKLFCEDLYHIDGEEIELRLIDTYTRENGELPFYWWNIVLKSKDLAMGKISFRIGHNYHSYIMATLVTRLMRSTEGIIIRCRPVSLC